MGTWRKEVVDRDLQGEWERSYACGLQAFIQLGMGRAKTVEKGRGRNEKLELMGAWRW
jgi:hypothetical protein